MALTISNYLVAAVVATATVYGSIDGPHGEFSEKELLGLADIYHYSEAISKRSIRSDEDVEDHHKKKHGFPDYKHCCGETDSRNHTGRKETWKIMKTCMEEMKAKYNDLELIVNPITDDFSCERLKRKKNRHYCIADCALKEAGVLQDGELNKDKAKEFLLRGISAEWLKEIAGNAVAKCTEQKDAPTKGEQLECSPRAGNIKHCVWKEIILNCPEEHFNKSTYCARVKKVFQEMEP